MKLVTTAIVALFASAAMAAGTTAAPTAAGTTAPATTEHGTEATGKTAAMKKEDCAAMTGEAKTKCETAMKKAHTK